MIEQGTFEQLRSQGGFVSNVVIHPGALEGQKVASVEQEKPQPPKAAVRPLDPSDLTRRIGDIAVYKYYFRIIGWKIVTVNLVSSFINMLGAQFPCKSYNCFVNINHTHCLLALWLNWYADGTISSISLFAAIYVSCAVVALSAATFVL